MPAAPEAEQLLELVDDHQHVFVGRNARLPDGVDEPARPRRSVASTSGAAVARELAGLPSTSGGSSAAASSPNGSSPGRNIGDAPAGPGADHLPAVE